LPLARDWHAAISVGSAIYVLGGHDSDSAPLASVLKFDSVQGSGAWIQTTPMPEVRFGHAACVVGRDVLVFGGQSDDKDDDYEIMCSVLKLDTLTNEWSTMAPMPLPCSGHSATVCGSLVSILGAGSESEVLCFDPA
jgi:N-acetylneuraminic acid mutarotase